MNAYVWQYVDGLTENWHPEGGTVVIAKTLEEARAMLPPDCGAQKQEPDAVYTLKVKAEAKVWIFPDAGCC